MIICAMVKTNKKGSYTHGEIKVDDDVLKDMSDEDRDDYIDRIAWDYAVEKPYRLELV
ncbi:hypothetical protein IC218_04540 [Clostridioides sp. ES-S-0005-03]|uniref:DUF7167 family protein n=1 Tax=Clostridioides sp. ES-S-0005-03 TaxID=2770774 RepID=UPI001D1147C5|nr:hypothetical protein [Clostridioides sp. ES-S-0005-03]